MRAELPAVLALTLVMLLPVPSVLACSCSPYYLKSTLPADGAVDVPTDVIIWANAGGVSKWRLQTEAGDNVEVKAREIHPSKACSTGEWLIAPVEPLQPSTHYVLGASWPEPPSGGDLPIAFTTGEGPLQDVKLETPKGIELAFMEPEGQCCLCFVEHSARLCDRGATADDATVLELTVFNPTTPPSRLAELEAALSTLPEDERRRAVADFIAWESPPREQVRSLLFARDTRRLPFAVPECVELRYRAVNGTRSDPLRLCGDELPVVRYSEKIEDCDAVFEAVDAGDLVQPPKPTEKEDAGAGAATRDAPNEDERAAARDDADGADSKSGKGDKNAAGSSRGCGASGGSHAPLGALLLGAALLLARRRPPGWASPSWVRVWSARSRAPAGRPRYHAITAMGKGLELRFTRAAEGDETLLRGPRAV